jgi:hypothetical protein
VGDFNHGSLAVPPGSRPRFVVNRVRNWRLPSRGHSANPTLSDPQAPVRSPGTATRLFCAQGPAE